MTETGFRIMRLKILAAMLALAFVTPPALAVEQCRFIQAKPEREACYQRQEAAGLAGCRGGHPGAFHDDDVDAAAAEEIGGAGADHAAAADHDAHECSVDERLAYRSVNGTPAFDLLTFWLSTIVTTTLSGVALKCFTTASVMSRISAFFCSGVRPSTAWT